MLRLLSHCETLCRNFDKIAEILSKILTDLGRKEPQNGACLSKVLVPPMSATKFMKCRNFEKKIGFNQGWLNYQDNGNDILSWWLFLCLKNQSANVHYKKN